MAAEHTVNTVALLDGSEMKSAVQDGLSENAGSPSLSAAASQSTDGGLASHASPCTSRARSLHSFPTGTWESRVHRQCNQLRQLFELPSTEVWHLPTPECAATPKQHTMPTERALLAAKLALTWLLCWAIAESDRRLPLRLTEEDLSAREVVPL